MALPLNNGGTPVKGLSPNNRPRWNGDELRAQLSLYDRKPFLDLLAEWLECSPSPEAINKFAEKYPDRYAGAIRQLAQIGGFTEKREVSVDVHVNIRQLSDSQLEDRLRALAEALEMPIPLVEVGVEAKAQAEPASPEGSDSPPK